MFLLLSSLISSRRPQTSVLNISQIGLKNIGTTYQCLVNKIFKNQMGRNMEVYIDDMIKKFVRVADHEYHQKLLRSFKKHKMWLNSQKCAIRVMSGKFLRFIMQQNGIEANLTRVK